MHADDDKDGLSYYLLDDFIVEHHAIIFVFKIVAMKYEHACVFWEGHNQTHFLARH